jgi:hypothetical protein
MKSAHTSSAKAYRFSQKSPVLFKQILVFGVSFSFFAEVWF